MEKMFNSCLFVSLQFVEISYCCITQIITIVHYNWPGIFHMKHMHYSGDIHFLTNKCKIYLTHTAAPFGSCEFILK